MCVCACGNFKKATHRAKTSGDTSIARMEQVVMRDRRLTVEENASTFGHTMLQDDLNMRKVSYRMLYRCKKLHTRNVVIHESPLTVLKEYSQDTTLHGIRYITRDGTILLDRICWLLAVVMCFTCAILFVHSAWIKYRLSPTVTTVDTTFYPLYKVPFPAVTICGSNNINKVTAEQILFRHLNTTQNRFPEKQLLNIIKILAKFAYPFYYDTRKQFDEAINVLPLFDTLNVTNFMLKVMPSCKEMFHSCFWQGITINCCKVFQLQRFDGGFCYSFNSLSAEGKSHCLSKFAKTELKIQGHETANHGPECSLRRNTASGITSGLEVYLQHSQANHWLTQKWRHDVGFHIMIHDPTNFPDIGHGMYLPENLNQTTLGEVKIVPTITETNPAVRKLAPKVRQCYFPDEQRLKINAEYTYRSCLLECRLEHIHSLCHCLPYFFSIMDEHYPICNISQMNCIVDHHWELRVFQPPVEAEGFRKHNRIQGMNCQHCFPTCHDNKYIVSTTSSVDRPTINYSIYLDIFYDNFGTIKYRRELVFSTVDLIVSFGGIASLFLGVSLLSGVELLYYATKLCRAIFHTIGNNPPKSDNHSTTPNVPTPVMNCTSNERWP